MSGEVTYSYPFKTQPFVHQYQAWKASKDLDWFAYLIDYGGGKSKVFIDNAAYLWDNKKINGALVVAPKGVYRNWFKGGKVAGSLGQIQEHFPDHIPYRFAWWDAQQRADAREATEALWKPGDVFRWYFINVESLTTDNGLLAALDFLKRTKCIMGVDESTIIKNHDAKRTKVVIRLGKLAPYRRILTGDPYANSPLDVYSQFEFLSPGSLGFASYFAFRARFAVMKTMERKAEKDEATGRTIKRPPIKYVVGYKDLEHLATLVAPRAFIVKKKDALPDLPPKIYCPPREVELTRGQRDAYEDMKRYSMVEIGRQTSFDLSQTPLNLSFEDLQKAVVNELQSVPTASAKIVLTQILRLQQIACGFVKTDAGEEVDLVKDEDNPKLNDLLEFASERPKGTKFIVWSFFDRSIKALERVLRAKFGSGSVVTYYGPTSDEARDAAKVAFQEDDGVLFFLGNPQTAGRGLTLTRAEWVWYHMNTFDNEIRANSEDRAHRIGLKHSVGYLNSIARNTIESGVAAALAEKKGISELLRDGSWKALFS